MCRLAPSILAADFSNLREDIAKAECAGADYLHIDVMDGKFVPSISFGMPVISSIRKVTKLPFDVHLMIEEPERYIREFVQIGADSITVQAEACTHLHRTVAMVKECGKSAGVALNPATSLSVLDYILPQLDIVLIMTVNPGYGGQKFLPFSHEKIRQAKSLIEKSGGAAKVQVDGGIMLSNAREVILSGADILVAGTAVFSGDILDNVARFKEIFQYGTGK